MKYLVLYDINGKIDPYGLRVRIIRELVKIKAFKIQKSTWILTEVSERLKSLLLEAEKIGGKVVVSKYEPVKLYEGINIGFVKSPFFKDSEFFMKIREAFEGKGFKLKEKSFGALSEHREPSDAINTLCGEGVDATVVIANAKSIENAMYMGYEVLKNSFLLSDSTAFIEIVKIEDSNKYTAISWTHIDPPILSILSSKLGIPIINGSSPFREHITVKGEFIYRRIFGVSSGEEIYIEKTPVAKAESKDIVIISHKGHIIGIMGAFVYNNKLKELDKVKLETAIVKSLRIPIGLKA